MRKFIIVISIGFALLFNNCNSGSPVKAENNVSTTGSVIALTNESFKQLVFNYEINKQWKYEGTLPAIIDFYADWCGPCRQLSPRIEEIAKEYAGKIIVYKVDTDTEKAIIPEFGHSEFANVDIYSDEWTTTIGDGCSTQRNPCKGNK